MGEETKNDFPLFSIEEKGDRAHIYLENKELKTVEDFKIEKCAEDGLLQGTVRLTLKIIVKFP